LCYTATTDNAAQKPSPGPGLLSSELPVLDPMRLVRRPPQPFLAVFLVIGIVPFEPHNAAVPLKSQDVGCDPIQKPPVMADDDRTAAEIFQGLPPSARRVFTSRSLVGSSNKSTLAPDFSIRARWTRLRSPPDRTPTFFCWSDPAKLKRAT
jgi:hypothetical protein